MRQPTAPRLVRDFADGSHRRERESERETERERERASERVRGKERRERERYPIERIEY